MSPHLANPPPCPNGSGCLLLYENAPASSSEMSVSLPDSARIAPESIRFQSQMQQLKDRDLHAARPRAARQIAQETLKRNRFFRQRRKEARSPIPSGRNRASWNRPHLNVMLSNAKSSRLLAQNYSRAPEATGFRDLQCGVEDRSVFAANVRTSGAPVYGALSLWRVQRRRTNRETPSGRSSP